MSVQGAIDPDELAMLTGILEEHCQSRGIAADSIDRDNLAVRLITLFASGITDIDDLKRALTRTRDPA
ncbi:hypothetical protein RFM68_19135 [Mesorhizobium sp. MSK_1335]|uniref:Uncharacterized protein n=1 Tax=Mesorhizobium montanum TaxID=3072323 RepID=A0ABU4ZMN2_9HYPH|nr:hypothetical protein [Mesorhizobium sp. MSK_1335]MDX8526619.1 hypothetical protein [Mesorhizobium sp. MSK_1335]